MTKEQLLATLRPFGQEHLLAFWDKLDPPGGIRLPGKSRASTSRWVRQLFDGRNQQGNVRELAARAEPPTAFPAEHRPKPLQPATGSPPRRRSAGRGPSRRRARRRRTREPVWASTIRRACSPSGRSRTKTLFQIHVEKITAAAKRYGVRIPLYLMTSPATHDETVAFFAAHERFGLPEEDLFVFCQGTNAGRGCPERPRAAGIVGRIATSPDGHGGMLAALLRTGALDGHRTPAESGSCSTSKSIIRWSISAVRSSSAITFCRNPSCRAR